MKRVAPILALVAAVLVIMIIRNASDADTSTGSADGPTESAPPANQAKIIIGWVKTASIRRDHPAAPYDREDDFPHWRDADEYGWTHEPNDHCDSREAALARDGRHVRVNAETCEVTAGTWTDPYTGTVITNPSELDIDHVVPLEEAYITGADHWTEAQRTRYANNPGVLLTVSASANRSKGDQSPAHWKPDNRADWCNYGIRWATVKHHWHLSYETNSEKTATLQLLTTCPKGK